MCVRACVCVCLRARAHERVCCVCMRACLRVGGEGGAYMRVCVCVRARVCVGVCVRQNARISNTLLNTHHGHFCDAFRRHISNTLLNTQHTYT